jgi:acyl dehydratase
MSNQPNQLINQSTNQQFQELKMPDAQFHPRGRYFEEFSIGDQVATSGRTITEADIVNFASHTGDFNEIHINADYAAGQMFGQRIAHGLLVLSIAVGLAVQTGFIERTVMAFRELDWKFSRPVMIGDTVRVVLEVTEIKEMARLGGGSVSMKVAVLNQRDEVVNRGNWAMLVASKNG